MVPRPILDPLAARNEERFRRPPTRADSRAWSAKRAARTCVNKIKTVFVRRGWFCPPSRTDSAADCYTGVIHSAAGGLSRDNNPHTRLTLSHTTTQSHTSTLASWRRGTERYFRLNLWMSLYSLQKNCSSHTQGAKTRTQNGGNGRRDATGSASHMMIITHRGAVTTDRCRSTSSAQHGTTNAIDSDTGSGSQPGT